MIQNDLLIDGFLFASKYKVNTTSSKQQHIYMIDLLVDQVFGHLLMCSAAMSFKFGWGLDFD